VRDLSRRIWYEEEEEKYASIPTGKVLKPQALEVAAGIENILKP